MSDSAMVTAALMGRIDERVDKLKDMINKASSVDSPSHYTAYEGLEVIDLTEQLSFNRGNIVKYVARAGLKDAATEVEDLEKAAWYLAREIARVKGKK